MAEITCPKCHTTFNISEEEYKSIKAQLRDQEFAAALHEREQAFERRTQDAVKLAEAAAAATAQRKIAEKETRIAELEAEIKAAEGVKSSAVNEIIAQKAAEITSLKGQLETKAAEQELAVKKAVAAKEAEVAELKAQIQAKATEQELAVKSAVSAKEEELSQKTIEIERLKGQIGSKEKEAELAQKNLKDTYEQQLKFKDDEIERIKDFKAKQSTKMVGESLEAFCKNEFDKMRPIGFQNAVFEKDNKVSESGSKGDFIFRESADGVEFISIMFEMKNEMDTTATKHKNEDFFKELDKDRREKNCEYAVLVTLLEPENDYYNSGIVDVSYKYEKMYVVRPQFFIPIITLLRNAAKNSLGYQKELMEVRNQNLDITNFETKLNGFKDKFDRDCRLAGNNFNTAIDEIDKTIKKLEKIKSELQKTVDHLSQGNNKLQDITIKKLVKGNPTMAAKFAELQEEQADNSD